MTSLDYHSSKTGIEKKIARTFVYVQIGHSSRETVENHGEPGAGLTAAGLEPALITYLNLKSVTVTTRPLWLSISIENKQ